MLLKASGGFRLIAHCYLLLLAGCSTVAQAPDNLEELYPLGARRETIRRQHGRVSESDQVRRDWLKSQASEPLKKVGKRADHDLVSYDVFTVWGGRGSSIGQPSVYQDVVYFDSEDRCIGSTRRKID